jgi:glycosyltransferase involved in cell wall biosynthesis
MNDITGVIITLNEEDRIRDAIQSLQTVCKEVIVVDSDSTDNTVALADAAGAKTYIQPYLGDGPQKNHGLRFASHDWIFSLDADEILSFEAAAAINGIDLENTRFEAFAFRRRNYIGSRWIKVCGWYPDYLIRLYNRHKTRYTDSAIHAKIISSNYCRIDADLHHYSYNNCGELFARAARYSSISAQNLHHRGRRAFPFSPFIHGLNSFVRKYFWQKGFVGGVDGLTIALSSAVNAYLKYVRLLEMQRGEDINGEPDTGGW